MDHRPHQQFNHGWRYKCSGCGSSCIRQSVLSILKTIRYNILLFYMLILTFQKANSKFPPGSTSSKLPPSKNSLPTIQIGSTSEPQPSHDTFISVNRSVLELFARSMVVVRTEEPGLDDILRVVGVWNERFYNHLRKLVCWS